jgi:hypothetical protein
VLRACIREGATPELGQGTREIPGSLPHESWPDSRPHRAADCRLSDVARLDAKLLADSELRVLDERMRSMLARAGRGADGGADRGGHHRVNVVAPLTGDPVGAWAINVDAID